eukprot:gene3430-3895_t
MKTTSELYLAVDDTRNGSGYSPPNSPTNHSSTLTANARKSLHSNMQLMGLLGFVNLAFSFYLAFGNIESGTCDISSTISCSAVIKSAYGELLNVPVSIFGITWNIVLLLGIWRIMLDDKVPHFISAIYIWCSAGIGFVIYFVAAEFILGALCPFCTIVHIINVTLMYLSFRVYNELRNPPTIGELVNALKPYIVFVFVLHVFAIVAFRSQPVVHDEWTMTKFAQCLTEKNMVFYGSSGCGACIRQKQLFIAGEKNEAESPMKYVNFVECFKNDVCKERDIGSYPTWLKLDSPNGKEIDRNIGIMDTAKLSKMSGCEYVEEDTTVVKQGKKTK